MTFWDQAFDIPGYKYGTAPNAFVREQAARLRPGGRVLVPGDGEGRNGVWLAAQGHEVLSVDGSAVGLPRRGNWRGSRACRCAPNWPTWRSGRPNPPASTPWC